MTETQRKLKKISILSIFLLIIVTIGWLLYKPEKEICFNGVKDIGEEGVDCGGFCEKKCPPPLKPPQVQDIKIDWVKYVKDGENNYDLVAKLSNSNERWGISSMKYKFTVRSQEGEVIGVRRGESYIMPKGFIKSEGANYIIENDFKTEKNIGKVDLELSDFNWGEIKDPRDLPDLSRDIIVIRNKEYGPLENGREFYYVSGVTKNVSKYSFFRVDIDVVLFDASGEPIAAGKTDQWTMKAGDGWKFEIRWLAPFSGEVDHVDYEAKTNIFNSSNFMKDYGTGRKYMIPR